nr:MAG TPA: hypothetical protein [Caudoviricetes sp.]
MKNQITCYVSNVKRMIFFRYLLFFVTKERT